MAYSSADVAFLSAEQVCGINRQMIIKSGGTFNPPQNLLNPSSLDYILSTIIDPNITAYDHLDLKEKSAKLAYHIITRHIFYDGK